MQLAGRHKEECSAQIRQRVVRTQQIQKERFKGSGVLFNSQMSTDQVQRFCQLDEQGEGYLEQMQSEELLSARAYFKLLKVARTIADMEQAEQIQLTHLTEALAFRSLDKKYWKPM